MSTYTHLNMLKDLYIFDAKCTIEDETSVEKVYELLSHLENAGFIVYILLLLALFYMFYYLLVSKL